jgi:hypothetical protein
MTGKLPEDLTVQHDRPSQRFWVQLDGFEACLMYRQQDRQMDLYHTYVPEVFRGRGIAERLCKAAFEHANAEQLTVIPSRSYISDFYLRRHKEYEPLVRRDRMSIPIVSG